MAARAPATILVVDDNPATRYSTSRVLRAEGFVVIEAASGQEALDLAAGVPDLVVLDVNLPDFDGFEVCRRLRADPRTARIAVIHLSATFVGTADQVHGLESGADGYITHPVEPPVLVATVNAFLRTRRAEEAMRASETKFRSVFDQAPNGIAILSDQLEYLDVNPAVERTLGRDESAIIGRSLAEFLAGPSEAILRDIADSLTGSGFWRGALAVRQSDGTEALLEWSFSVHSVPGTVLATTSDITERKAIEAEREQLLSKAQQAQAEAERANSIKDDFLAALSHELRTPLNAIVGWSAVVKRRAQFGDPEILKGVEAIERNARVQTQLIADLLDVARITSGKLTLSREWFDPREAIDLWSNALSTGARARQIQIETQLEATPKIHWDQGRFQQVIWNLMDNAVKFSDKGGMVSVRMDATDTDTEIRVSDSGRGISPAFLPHIFERFQQEEVGSARGRGGLGLGLAIVKHLVDAHGATIAAESDGVNKGSTFIVRIPREAAPATARASQAPPQPVLHGLRILLVENDPDARTLVTEIFRDAHAEVLDAGDVQSALAALTSFAPHLLVSDLGMPGQDGYDLIREVRRRGHRPDTLPAIALTAFAREEDRDEALQAGYQRHIVKPAEPQALLRAAFELAGTGRT